MKKYFILFFFLFFFNNSFAEEKIVYLNVNFLLTKSDVGKYINNEMNFDLDEIPGKLQQILYKFLSAHLSKMKEESVINKQTPVKRV